MMAFCPVENMEKLEEKTADSSTEKHVPFIVEEEDGYFKVPRVVQE